MRSESTKKRVLLFVSSSNEAASMPPWSREEVIRIAFQVAILHLRLCNEGRNSLPIVRHRSCIVCIHFIFAQLQFHNGFRKKTRDSRRELDFGQLSSMLGFRQRRYGEHCDRLEWKLATLSNYALSALRLRLPERADFDFQVDLETFFYVPKTANTFTA